MSGEPILRVVFYRTESGREPVREWLLSLPALDRRMIGEDIKLVQFRWPLGMPWVRKLDAELWEVRCSISAGQIARVCFTVRGSEMALLHGFVKKSQKTARADLDLARERHAKWQAG